MLQQQQQQGQQQEGEKTTEAVIKEVSFYEELGVSRTVSPEELAKAHRKKSIKVHPDKNNSPEAQKLFTRYGTIFAILKDPESRARYDFFLDNGVPVWRGTGYMYQRHRPGLKSVLVALLTFASLVHYLLSWVDALRKQKRKDEAIAALKGKKRRTAKEEALLEDWEAVLVPRPRIFDTFLFLLLRGTYHLAKGLVFREKTGEEEEEGKKEEREEAKKSNRRRKKEKETWHLDDM